MRRKERYVCIMDHFRKEMPHVTTELEFGSVFQLLVATMLSAQCTDKRIYRFSNDDITGIEYLEGGKKHSTYANALRGRNAGVSAFVQCQPWKGII